MIVDSIRGADVIRAGFAGVLGFIIANYLQKLMFSDALYVGGIVFVSVLGGDFLYGYLGPQTAYTLGIAE